MRNTFSVIRNTLVLILLLASMGYAQEYKTEDIVQAIYHAEGGRAAAYPFGIVSLKYENRTDRSLSRHDWAKWICTNTVNNHKKRHAGHNCGRDFLECLQRRYCPVGADNDLGTNQYWLKNVRWYLKNQ